MENKPNDDFSKTMLHLQSLFFMLVITLCFLLLITSQVFNNSSQIFPFSIYSTDTTTLFSEQSTLIYNKDSEAYWVPLSMETLKGSGLQSQIEYGRELIVNTSRYLGPNGSVAQISNGMNCQNCHLDAGTRVFGNNYGSVYATYPRFRARSGTMENIYKRVNDCFERSLNGTPLDTLGAEMQAIKAYLMFLGKNVVKGTTVKGSGLKSLPFLDRAADPEKGKYVYIAKCASCHQQGGQGVLAQDRTSYVYPPLWGNASYNDAAGLYRISNFAKYVKYNMPLGATHENPQLSDEEAWDVAAYVNSRPRPHKNVPQDWPDIKKKPIDHPFEPYADSFGEREHKFGPFQPIDKESKALK
jgi:thiosulfate dehydrogenase